MTARFLARTALVIALLLSFLAIQACGRRASAVADPAGPGVTLSVDGRPFNLYTPPALDGRSGPVVLVLHGGLSSAEQVQSVLPLFDQAAATGFRLAYLDGTLQGRERANRRTWNAGSCCSEARDQNVDDVGYLADVISTLVGQGLTTPDQVFLIGHSNGAMMSYRFACTRPDLVGGVMSLSGVLVIPACANASGVRILQVHGIEDPIVPIEGGGGGERLTGAPFRSVQQTADGLRAGGARVDTLLVPGATHAIQSLDENLRATQGLSLAARLGQFVQGI